jgi:two-component system response regulator VicR
MKILIVEDNDIIARGLEYSLSNEGFITHIEQTIDGTKSNLQDNHYDLIILDISLPDGNGFDLCKYIKEHFDTPIIFLTAKDEEKDIVQGFDLGAEDYIIKPFRNRELISRINNVLRHHHKESNIIKNGNIDINLDENRVYKNNKEVILTALEYKILVLLYSNLDKTITREMILDKIWDIAGNFVNDNTLTVYIKRIREKLDTEDIVTIKGIGYRVNKHE